ncbi:MAG: hypothetical protein ACOC38_08960, partial [Promethearchaeia archaeon]
MPSPLHRKSHLLLFGILLLLLAPFVTIGANGSQITYPEEQKIDISFPSLDDTHDGTDQLSSHNVVKNPRSVIPESIPFAGFVKNLGQGGSSDILFYHTSSRLSVAFHESKITFAVRDEATYRTTELLFEGSSDRQPIGKKKSMHQNNYFIGDDRFMNVRAYQEIWYPDLYDNIDLRYFMTEKGLKYEFIVRPGGDPSDIRLSVGDESSIRVEKNTVTILSEAGVKPILEDTGLVSFMKDGEEISSQFRRISSTSYGFEVSSYDETQTLIIDPWNIAFSTYLGGGNLDRIVDMTSREGGEYVFLVGTASSGFPTKDGYDESAASTDAVVCKLNSTGGLVFSTFIGGNHGEWGHGIAIDDLAQVYITGRTSSKNFPTTENAYQSNQASSRDAFIAILNATGNGLMYGSYLGGSEYDAAYDIDICWCDSEGGYYSPHIIGYTSSTDFPVTFGSYQGGDNDAFVARFNSTGGLNFSRFLGGSHREWSNTVEYAIEVGEWGHAYVTGSTYSSDFPVTGGSYQEFEDLWEGFVTKLNPTGMINWSTFVGGDGNDYALDLELVSSGTEGLYNVYVGGRTYSTNMYTGATGYDNSLAGEDDAFIMELSADGKNLLAATYLGGSERDVLYGISCNSESSVYATGMTMSDDFPTVSPYEDTFAGPLDAYVVNLTTDLNSLTFSTYLGGSDSDEGRAILDRSDGSFTVAGFTYSPDFPITNAFQETHGGDTDGFLTDFRMDTESPTIALSGIANESVQPSAGDIPLLVEDN